MYAVPGVGNQAVEDHLEDIRNNVMLFAQEAEKVYAQFLEWALFDNLE